MGNNEFLWNMFDFLKKLAILWFSMVRGKKNNNKFEIIC